MIRSEISVIEGGSPGKNLLVSAHGSLISCMRGVLNLFSDLIPTEEPDIDKVKEDIWRELSAVYYKYDDNHQKKAFREVVQDISARLGDGNWRSVYNKIHKIEQRGPGRASPLWSGRALS